MYLFFLGLFELLKLFQNCFRLTAAVTSVLVSVLVVLQCMTCDRCMTFSL